MSSEEIDRYTNEKEEIYRDMYKPYIKPVNGLITLLKQLQALQVPMVIATSGIPVNIEYMFENIPVRKYFMDVINSTHITHGKPHPEIYQVAARRMQLNPAHCIAFEDSVAGVRSAADAGFKTVALTTTHQREELQYADLIVTDFTEISIEKLSELLEA